MDEIWFRLSSQLEVLQVETSVILQHGQQWLSAFIVQCRRILQELNDEEYFRQLKEIGLRIIYLLQRNWDELQYKITAFQFNTRAFYHQIGNLFSNGVSGREVGFFLIGIATGSLIGFCIGQNWRNSPRHLHNMKAIICHHYKGVEGVCMVEDIEMPMIQKKNELLVQVKAASVHDVDINICHGYYKTYRRILNSGRHKDLPVTLGRDCAGIVVDIGQNVVNFDIGDEVFLAVPAWAPGTMAEYIVVPETQVAKRPKLVTFEACASLPYSGCIAWDALVNGSVIKEGNAKGKRVLIFGGSTPVGCILTQLIKLWGGYVVSACRPHAVPVTRALGADEVIPLGESDIEKELELRDKYDAIFYTGGQATDASVLKRYLSNHGSYISTVPKLLTSDSLGLVFGSLFAGCVRLQLVIQYFFGMSNYKWKDGAKINVNYLRCLQELVDADKLQTVVDRVFSPVRIDQALDHIMDPNAIGSTVIKFH
ncbi:reticulon-4-interacting protein 1, mitochondrial-like [Leptopilina boulardi]|uniref:reticulon-4-interacting protein 1, mitochondrial-like n=1 Tax=Leptopilina boulardi TaxID=63433 RepID=UPI0021F66792|nr:reticulon-4-interacting protein 1, mitochondrial-like [Leptopilina boulardi]XP_051168506.1 reticulon-4-interacting protein 1, mitochondrial-like [Leptopilina boulardi]XP_051168507.1 reticulon-4-interacting protein 1, mitochondrial-like [Leptopilina boulardi]XP_051168508.1 reticulon-4-interacting protein 1, mitochondrial-like [Leptopilina boulardi]